MENNETETTTGQDEKRVEEIKEIDLDEVLNTPTELKAPAFDVKMEETTQDQGEGLSEDDFDEEADEPIIPPDAKEVLYDSAKLAPTIIEVVDTLLSKGMPFAYEATLSSEDRAAMKVIARKYKAQRGKQVLDLSEDDIRVTSIFIDYEDYCNELKLTEQEKKSLIEPLTELLKDVNYKTSPGWALVIASFLIMIPRLIPLGINIVVEE
jgi:hypothetical protein